MNYKLKLARIKKGLLQKDIAKNIGTTERTYSNYENGKRKIKVEDAIKIANVLDKTVEELFTTEEEPFTNENIKIERNTSTEEIYNERII
ncbi:MAG: helix-turn-helix transcriptional regulator [Clostridium sp.]|uniref:helix-turn-helix transcriptional regulator n=1 Tax=Clostridium sp. TaxID=1506 RepID=UPI00306EB0A5